MEKGENLNDIINKIKGVEDGINQMIVPMLKDTINDYKKTFNKMVIIIVMLIVGLLGVIGYSSYLIAEQTDKYNDFLSQFEFESDEIYTQDFDTSGDSSLDVNSGINVKE